MKKIIAAIGKLNPEKIVLSGGEPLLREDILDILQQVKSMGIKTVLQSNAILLKERINELAPYIDWISLSLDGDSESTNSILRGPNHFEKVLNILPILKNLDIPVKLGTVVTKKNLNSIPGIGKLIGLYVNIWKLYQFYPRENCLSDKYKKEFEVDLESYLNVMKEVKQRYPLMEISQHTIKDFEEGPCILIHPDGNVYISKGMGDKNIGNILESPKGIIEECKKSGILKNIEKNYEKTYKDKV